MYPLLLNNNRRRTEDAKGELNVPTQLEFHFQSRQQNQTLDHTRLFCNQNQK